MIFVLVITLWSLITLTIKNFESANGFDVAMINGIAALVFIVLAIYLAVTALLESRIERRRFAQLTTAP